MSENAERERFDRYKEILLDIIHRRLPGCKVYLFGSRARQEHLEGADIDLAIDAEKKIEFRIISSLHGEISEASIPLHVDLVDLHTVPDELKKEVEKEGILWVR